MVPNAEKRKKKQNDHKATDINFYKSAEIMLFVWKKVSATTCCMWQWRFYIELKKDFDLACNRHQMLFTYF